MDITSRDDAIASGLKYYFTGERCPSGHVAPRRVANRNCLECSRKHGRDKYARKLSEDPVGYRLQIKESIRRRADKEREWRSAYYQKNKAKHLKIVSAWAKKNPESRRATESRRRAAAKGSNFTAEDVRWLMESQVGLCAGCRISLKDGYHIDHRVPLSKGGSNGSENIQLLCPPCNLSKGAKDHDEWVAQKKEARQKDH